MNLEQLGEFYTVLDYDDGTVKQIIVISSEDLFDITKQFRGREHHGGRVRRHMADMRALVSNPFEVSWYAATPDEFSVEGAILLARNQGNSVVVTEVIRDQDSGSI